MPGSGHTCGGGDCLKQGFAFRVRSFEFNHVPPLFVDEDIRVIVPYGVRAEPAPVFEVGGVYLGVDEFKYFF